MEDTPNIRKKEEFEAFIGALAGSSIAHWKDIAEAVGVDKDTITEWKKHPRAQEARIKGIEYALNQMELSGKNDWRMWEKVLKMLGLNADTTMDARDETEQERRTENLRKAQKEAGVLQQMYQAIHELEEEKSKIREAHSAQNAEASHLDNRSSNP